MSMAPYSNKIKILIISLVACFHACVLAEDVLEIEVKIKDHIFYPSEIEAPAGKKLRLVIHNEDDTIEEFESFDLKREKIVPVGGKINIIIAPLPLGKYEFFGDFHQDTAKGVINVK